MKRKLIKQGIGALTITLPKDWISRYNLKAGNEIDMEEQEKNLILKTDGGSSILKRVTISIDGLNQALIWRHIISAYRLGYDEIRVEFSDIKKLYDIKFASLIFLEKKVKMDTLNVIRDAATRCIGLEIIDQGNNYCIIKDLGETSEKEFDNAIRRIFLLLLSMTEESLSGLKKNNDIKNSVISSDISIDKFTDFCLRILNKRSYKKLNKTNSIYAAIILFEFIGDEYKRIVFHIDEKAKYSQKFIDIYENINKLLNLYYELFYKFSNEKIVNIFNLDEQLTNEIRYLSRKLNNDEREILHHLKKIKRYIADLLQLKIDLEI